MFFRLILRFSTHYFSASNSSDFYRVIFCIHLFRFISWRQVVSTCSGLLWRDLHFPPFQFYCKAVCWIHLTNIYNLWRPTESCDGHIWTSFQSYQRLIFAIFVSGQHLFCFTDSERLEYVINIDLLKSTTAANGSFTVLHVSKSYEKILSSEIFFLLFITAVTLFTQIEE